jgi:hypothetical protein
VESKIPILIRLYEDIDPGVKSKTIAGDEPPALNEPGVDAKARVAGPTACAGATLNKAKMATTKVARAARIANIFTG